MKVTMPVVAFLMLQPSAAFADHCDTLKFAGTTVDQDLLLDFTPGFKGLNEDRDYTMGVHLTYCSNHVKGNLFKDYRLHQSLLRGLGALSEDTKNKQYSLSFNISAFTPDNLRAREPVTTDTPYSSILSVTSTMTAADNPQKLAHQVGLTFGVLGLSVAKWGQTLIHEANRAITKNDYPYNPKGWHNQISDGFEPTAMLSVSRHQRIDIQSKWIDLGYFAEGTLGYQTGATIGMSLKLGQVDKKTPVWMLTKGAGYSSSSHKRKDGVRGGEFYVQFTTQGSWMAYDVLLQGQFRKNRHELTSDQVDHFFYKNTAGLGYRRAGGNNWLYSCSRKSAIHKLPTARDHYWCGITFSRNF
jgi:hypothetical protein